MVWLQDLTLRHIQLGKSQKFWMSLEELVLAQLAAGKHCEYLPKNTITNKISYALTITDLSTVANADTNTYTDTD